MKRRRSHLRRPGVVVLAVILAAAAALRAGVPAATANAAYTTANLTYHSGHLMENPTNYPIFWLPSGYHYTSAATAADDTTYENFVKQYFTDICGTALDGVDTQYSQPGEPIDQACALGDPSGTCVDTTAFPAGTTAGTTDTSKALHDVDIRAAVTWARSNCFGGDPGASKNIEYFVYTPLDIQECFGDNSECTFTVTGPGGPLFCAWHNSTGNEVYAFISDRTASNCSTGTGPNGSNLDTAADTSEHEQMESNTNPYGNGWYNGDNAHENGDQCNFYFGSADTNADGTNYIANGHKYRIQWEWSNLIGADQGSGDFGTSGCAPSYSPTTKVLPGSPHVGLTATAQIEGNTVDDVAYTVSYSNSSNTDGLYSTTIQIILPADLAYTSGSGSPAVTSSGHVVTYNVGAVGVQGSGSFTFHASPVSALLDGTTETANAKLTSQDQVGAALPDQTATASTSIFNAAPTLAPVANQTLDYSDALTFTVTGHDGNANDTLSLTVDAATPLPAGLTFGTTNSHSPVTGTVSGNVTADPGTYPVTFDVTDFHHSSPTQVSMSITVNKEDTTLTYTGDTVIAQGSNTAHLSARLLADGDPSQPVAGKPVDLSVGSGTGAQHCSPMPVTDASGVASCTLSSITVPQGPQAVNANFAGDTDYLGSSDSKTAIVFAFLNQGSFDLGDKTVAAATATTTVTWWGNNWSSLNSLTAGAASPSFKGFDATLSTQPPACGGTWTTSPGNSPSPPPASSIPSYMGVVVSTGVAKSGSTVSGDIKMIVVVKTSAGYGPNPGSTGTGTIVATYCQS